MAEPYFDDRTQCYLRGVQYDFSQRCGFLLMEERSCTDMSGAIGIFTAIDPAVMRIETYSGDRPDTLYFRPSIEDPWDAWFWPRE